MAGISPDQQLRLLAAEITAKTMRDGVDPVELAERWIRFLKADDNRPKLVSPTVMRPS